MNIVLLWNFKYFCDGEQGNLHFTELKNKTPSNTIYLAYNWDPMPPTKSYSPHRMNLIKMLNCYITCDGREIKYLWDQGQYNFIYGPAGYDPAITYYISDHTYECDISMVCTNLYTDFELFPLEYVNVHRKNLVDILYQHRNEFIFHIYGSSNVGNLYPECYKGYISYDECPKVFSNSKINLCIHATSNNNYQNNIYFSERLPQILGSHGLLYCETVYDYLLIPDNNYVLANINDPLTQILDIIHNYDSEKYKKIKDNGYELAKNFLTWKNFCDCINIITHQ